MNSHQENISGQDESGGYPCKECNIVYKSKKSLWVHKNKKHPRHPVPSLCDSCEKTFFDRNELCSPGKYPRHSNSRHNARKWKWKSSSRTLAAWFIKWNHFTNESTSEWRHPAKKEKTSCRIGNSRRPIRLRHVCKVLLKRQRSSGTSWLVF